MFLKSSVYGSDKEGIKFFVPACSACFATTPRVPRKFVID